MLVSITAAQCVLMQIACVIHDCVIHGLCDSLLCDSLLCDSLLHAARARLIYNRYSRSRGGISF